MRKLGYYTLSILGIPLALPMLFLIGLAAVAYLGMCFLVNAFNKIVGE